MVVAKERKAHRTPDQIVADLEAKIASVKARAARKNARARPEIRLTIAARRALSKAHETATEVALKGALHDAGQLLESALGTAMASNIPPVATDAPARSRRGRRSSASDNTA